MSNYEIVYLEQAKEDLLKIVAYISEELKNVSAAEKLAEKIISTVENLKQFPYANSVYTPVLPLKREYRKIIVENYLVFYYVNEEEKRAVISRIIFARRNLIKQIKNK